jgi:hypothetical protein
VGKALANQKQRSTNKARARTISRSIEVSPRIDAHNPTADRALICEDRNANSLGCLFPEGDRSDDHCSGPASLRFVIIHARSASFQNPTLYLASDADSHRSIASPKLEIGARSGRLRNEPNFYALVQQT